MSVFNVNDNKSHLDKTAFFDDPVTVARYDSVKYPIFDQLTRKQMGFFWVPEEVDLLRDAKDFKELTDVENTSLLQTLNDRSYSTLFRVELLSKPCSLYVLSQN